ncbi:Schizosaccharomyces specific protein Mcp3 [Schizosaccharomyces pombe]|uniref:Meiotic coiled-coil protein 3 n=1 Tax=Schizosaccharomyces pombe (strain 972 / ATCC 24843) TaxID=284812 RepID=MCP3_SCHPO|nr:protein mcp3 [Schizosaccharomyces pombe]Q9UTR7.1 RecName: Full=Meiotic coiled-coil protein 3; AltName: Full=Meiotically up-regulated gene 7 protein [Schizosaccharomyces pombe 972h-]BAD42851.1 meiotic coiled-coil protein 3 [Schizosaccharomyces pombe]CAB60234.1 sequence orphan [Schizosaccharomyces pombe]|eukprot:NP_594851.1 protein mcp3 [Schizosaccharomyces pombe]
MTKETHENHLRTHNGIFPVSLLSTQARQLLNFKLKSPSYYLLNSFKLLVKSEGNNQSTTADVTLTKSPNAYHASSAREEKDLQVSRRDTCFYCSRKIIKCICNEEHVGIESVQLKLILLLCQNLPNVTTNAKKYFSSLADGHNFTLTLYKFSLDNQTFSQLLSRFKSFATLTELLQVHNVMLQVNFSFQARQLNTEIQLRRCHSLEKTWKFLFGDYELPDVLKDMESSNSDWSDTSLKRIAYLCSLVEELKLHSSIMNDKYVCLVSKHNNALEDKFNSEAARQLLQKSLSIVASNLKQAENKTISYEEKLSIAQNSINEIQTQNRDLKLETEKLQDQIKALLERNQSLQEALETVKNDEKNLREMNANYETEMKEARQKLNNKEALISHYDDDFRAKELKISRLSESLREKAGLLEFQSSVSEQRDLLYQEQIQSSIKDMENVFRKNEYLMEELNELKNNLEVESSKVLRLDEEMKCLKDEQLSQFDTVFSLTDERDGLQKDLKNTKGNLDDEIGRSAFLKSQIRDQELTIEKLHDSLETLSQTNNSLQCEISEKNAELNSVNSKLSEGRAHLETANKENEILKQQLELSESKLASLLNSYQSFINKKEHLYSFLQLVEPSFAKSDSSNATESQISESVRKGISIFNLLFIVYKNVCSQAGINPSTKLEDLDEHTLSDELTYITKKFVQKDQEYQTKEIELRNYKITLQSLLEDKLIGVNTDCRSPSCSDFEQLGQESENNTSISGRVSKLVKSFNDSSSISNNTKISITKSPSGEKVSVFKEMSDIALRDMDKNRKLLGENVDVRNIVVQKDESLNIDLQNNAVVPELHFKEGMVYDSLENAYTYLAESKRMLANELQMKQEDLEKVILELEAYKEIFLEEKQIPCEEFMPGKNAKSEKSLRSVFQEQLMRETKRVRKLEKVNSELKLHCFELSERLREREHTLQQTFGDK